MGNKRNFVDSIAVVHGVYDARGQLLAVRENGADVERYAYDRAGNMVRKTVRGRTTTYAFDGANQLVSSTCDGVTTRYAYDAAGRLVREGDKTYRYGYLDKVLSVTDGKRSYAYAYHVDGQLARADYGDGRSEDFLWDGLALVRRGDESFVNEPHVGDAPKKLRFGGKPRAKRSARRARKGPRGNPVLSSKGVAYLNDLLGTTVGTWGGRAAQKRKEKRRYSAAALTAFGEPLPGAEGGAAVPSPFFTGKPDVPGLGRVFLFRNYRPGLAKWQTADPLGYPDGWNALAYCKNEVTRFVDYLGAACTEWCKCGSGSCGCGVWVYPSLFGDGQHYFMGRDGMPIFNPENEIMNYMEDNFPGAHYFAAVHDSWVGKLVDGWGLPDLLVNIPSMPIAYVFGFFSTSYDKFADFINYLQDQLRMPNVKPIWLEYCSCKEKGG